MSDWIVRPAVAEDEPCLVSMWVRGMAFADDAGAREEGSDAAVRHWRVFQPVVTSVLRHSEVRVACPEERSTYAPGKPAVIMGWSCTSPGYVHWVSVKRNLMREDREGARELVRDLLGRELNASLRVTFKLNDMARIGMAPPAWEVDYSFSNFLRRLSTMREENDALLMGVVRSLMTSGRWRTSGERNGEAA